MATDKERIGELEESVSNLKETIENIQVIPVSSAISVVGAFTSTNYQGTYLYMVYSDGMLKRAQLDNETDTLEFETLSSVEVESDDLEPIEEPVDIDDMY